MTDFHFRSLFSSSLLLTCYIKQRHFSLNLEKSTLMSATILTRGHTSHSNTFFNMKIFSSAKRDHDDVDSCTICTQERPVFNDRLLCLETGARFARRMRARGRRRHPRPRRRPRPWPRKSLFKQICLALNEAAMAQKHEYSGNVGFSW